MYQVIGAEKKGVHLWVHNQEGCVRYQNQAMRVLSSIDSDDPNTQAHKKKRKDNLLNFYFYWNQNGVENWRLTMQCDTNI